MEVSEKKLGCLAGTKRTNMSKCGYVEGSVNESLPNGGRKEVCVIDGKAVFWIVNDYDVTVSPEDVASYVVSGVNVFAREYSRNVDNKRIFFDEHTVDYNINFTNCTNGTLMVKTINVEQPGADYKAMNLQIFNKNFCPKDYVPEVAGWLNPQGEIDDQYDAVFCPEGYSAHIIGFRKVSSFCKNVALVKALGLDESPLTTTVKFGGQDLPFIRVKK